MTINIFNYYRHSRFKYIWYFIKAYPHLMIGILALSISSALFDGMNILFLFSILNSAMGVAAENSMGSGLLKFTNSILRFVPIKDAFVGACVLLMISVLLRNTFLYFQKIFSSYAGYKIWEDFQQKVYVKSISADYQYFLDHKQGEIIFRIDTAPGVLGGVLKIIPDFIVEFVRLLTLGTILVGISAYASGAIIVIGLGYYYLTKSIASNISYNLGKGRIKACEKQKILLNETISGIRQIKVFASEKRWTNEFFGAMRDFFRLALIDSRWIPLPSVLLESLTLSFLALLLIIAKLFYPGNFSSLLPVLASFGYAFQKIMPSLSQIGNLRIQIMGTLPTIELLYSVFKEKSQTIADGENEVREFNDAIKFEDVNFSYPGRKGVLENVTLSFKKGQTTAIVGPSGAGKSTIADLIVRLFLPNSGHILVDDLDLKECNISSWLSKIGFVTQDTFIFHASLADNIAFGLQTSKEEIIRAARDANAHDFIMEFPENYATIVGDRGMKLSGGQRQRIAIARALIHNPEILILDEATSSLDNFSERIVQEAINKISTDRTVIVIAHRLSTVINADKIIVIDKGKIIEEGGHDDLISRQGFYWKLYNREKQGGVEPKICVQT
ncbi:ABC transporter ATP-binding protein [Candidatus Margulisiibacteriota bacterium]